MSAVAEIETLIQEAAARYGPAVVGVGRGWGTGSGVIVGPGQVLVSAHSLREPEVTLVLGDGESRPGRVAGADPDLDLAVVQVDTGDIEPVAWDPDASGAAVGQAVLALANPGGRGLRVTFGFVTSVGRSFRGGRGRRVTGAIEHSAPLPRGSSGGPLLDTSGRLLGVNAVRADGGLILATPADGALRERVEGLAQGNEPRRARLGVALAPPRAARELRRAVGLPERPGLLVRAVQDGSPAAGAGLRRGDLIVRLGERETARIDDLHEALDASSPGGPIELGVVRGSEELALTVEA
ncbi:MAG TPA: S1C family serine protease [Solirubrobacteraceae bacterium]|nr:S1C family serine protease [Solirubrobacteraceae bacterium]